MDRLISNLSLDALAYYNRNYATNQINPTGKVVNYQYRNYSIVSTVDDLVIIHPQSMLIITASKSYLIANNHITSTDLGDIVYDIFHISSNRTVTFNTDDGSAIIIYRNCVTRKQNGIVEYFADRFFELSDNLLPENNTRIVISFRNDYHLQFTTFVHLNHTIRFLFDDDQRVISISGGKINIKYSKGRYYYNCQRKPYYITEQQVRYLYHHPYLLLKFYQQPNSRYNTIMEEILSGH